MANSHAEINIESICRCLGTVPNAPTPNACVNVILIHVGELNVPYVHGPYSA